MKGMMEELLLLKKKKLEALIDELEGSAGADCSGHLRVASRGGKPEYYLITKDENGNKDHNGTYIKKGDRELAKKLAEKEYRTKLLAAARKQLGSICRFLNSYQEDRLEAVFEKLPPLKKALVTPLVESEEEFVRRWESVQYVGRGDFDSKSPLYAERGEQVRSKSEKIIADKLFSLGIPYRYEQPLYLPGWKTIFPDFRVLKRSERKEFIWEHFGIMDSEDYLEKFFRKMENYNKNGYFIGKNLIVTFESGNNPINTRQLDSIIHEYLL